ncbi:uncharacterized protein si:zfos-1056e6.1 isoform X2 [Hippocampus zosterae]|uniref:uncharacterized protein si:zfos-1056e6.1 isoform X2 n=1 Tax=Hippocampus zosterae TaxID=109293 RepID=UPI00223E8129|nr:uncharacterized protein si:zfos-1056e6.1 isoform X2 [Hippocampus zosterae]
MHTFLCSEINLICVKQQNVNCDKLLLGRKMRAGVQIQMRTFSSGAFQNKIYNPLLLFCIIPSSFVLKKTCPDGVVVLCLPALVLVSIITDLRPTGWNKNMSDVLVDSPTRVTKAWVALRRLDKNDDRVVALREVSIPQAVDTSSIIQIIASSFNLNSSDVVFKIRNQRGCLIPLNSSIPANSKHTCAPYVLRWPPEDTTSAISPNNLKYVLVRPQKTFPLCISPSLMSSGPSEACGVWV